MEKLKNVTMKVEVEITPDDYKHFLLLVLSGVYDGKIKQSHFAEFEPVVNILIISALIIANFTIPKDVMAIDLFSVSLGVMLAWFTTTTIRSLKIKQGKQTFFPDPEDPVFARTTYSFEDTKILWNSTASSGSYDTFTLKKVFEDDQLLLLFQSNNRALVFPKDQLGKAQIDFIRQWSNERINSDSSPN